MTDRVPIALLGTGGMARRHVNGLRQLDRIGRRNVDLAAVYGRNLAKAEELADEIGAALGVRPSAFDDVAAMARALPELRAADVCTDAASHHALAVGCCEVGLHLLVEKPLALTVRGCDLVVDAAVRHGRILAVAENYRLDPMNRLVKALVDDGAIGQLRQWIEHRAGWGRDLFITPWRHQRASGTVTLDTGIHYADLLLYVGGRVESVYGEGRIFEPKRYRTPQLGPANLYARWVEATPEVTDATGEDALFAYLRFANGAIGQWTLNFAAYCAPEYRRTLYGSRGTLHCPNDRGGRSPRLERDGATLEGEALLELAPSYRMDPIAAELFGAERPTSYSLPMPEIDARWLALELHELGRCVATGAQPEVTGGAGRAAVALVNAVFESGVRRAPVALADVESGRIDDYQREIDLAHGLAVGDI